MAKKIKPIKDIVTIGMILKNKEAEVAFFRSMSLLSKDERSGIKNIRISILSDDTMSVYLEVDSTYTIFQIGKNYK